MKLPWIPAWWHPGESLWSVSNKLAYVLTATVGDVLDLLLGPVHKRREAIWFANFQTAAQVHRLLKIRMDHPDGHLFAALNTSPSLGEREQWRLRVRYCPECIRDFVHRSQFQDSRVALCSLHDRPLLDFCEYCHSALDPMSPTPWTCSGCQEPLAFPGCDWPKLFRKHPARNTRVQVGPAIFEVARSRYFETWYLLQMVYEEHASLAHVLLSGHEGCAARDEPAAMGNFDSTTFECPVAAALMLLGVRLGLTSSSILGGWPGHRYVSGRSAIGELQYFVAGFDRTEAPMAVRLAVRTWLLDCLETCLEAASSGRYEVSWFAQEDQLRRQAGRLELDALPGLIKVAGAFCRTGRSNAPSRLVA